MRPAPVLILAAGRGHRLSPLTDNLPKCLLQIGETSPLDLILRSLTAAPVSEVLIVVGHARHRIASFLDAGRAPYPVRQLWNPRYETANNIYSAALARESCEDGFLLINSDVVFHPRILDIAFAPPEESALVVDPTLPPRSEAMKVRYDGLRLTAIAKNLDPASCNGEYIGVARFDPPGARAFFRHASAILARGGEEEWYEAAIEGAAREVPFGLRSTAGLPWIEIDDFDDLRRAELEVLPLIPR